MNEDLRGRLDRVEESVAFADRQAEVLGEQVREAFERLRAISARLEAMERRLHALAEPPVEPNTDDDADPTMTEPT